MTVIIFLCVYLALATNNYIVGARITNISSGDYEDLDLERQLKILNKPPVKTFEGDGYIIDCIDINKQPAFDHPLLKNHKIQLKPSFEVTTTKSTRLSRIGIEEVFCPNGTVPIRRTTKDDLIRAKQLSNLHVGTLNEDIPGRYYAGVELKDDDLSYFGISGIIDVYNLPVQNEDQITSAYIYLANGGVNDKSVIMAGWEVHPKVFGDAKTYFFIRWADKSQNKGCTNLLCPGFVQIDTSFPLDKPVVTQTSTYDGEQFEIALEIELDTATNNWWVRLQNKSLGYYPGVLFSNLAVAKSGGWTGMTSTPTGIPSPPMGSGHFPDNYLKRSCYIRQMKFKSESGPLEPENHIYAFSSTDSPICYLVDYYGYNDDFQGYATIFGGPGGNCDE